MHVLYRQECIVRVRYVCLCELGTYHDGLWYALNYILLHTCMCR